MQFLENGAYDTESDAEASQMTPLPWISAQMATYYGGAGVPASCPSVTVPSHDRLPGSDGGADGGLEGWRGRPPAGLLRDEGSEDHIAEGGSGSGHRDEGRADPKRDKKGKNTGVGKAPSEKTSSGGTAGRGRASGRGVRKSQVKK